MVTPTPRKNKVPNILGDWDDVRFFLAVAKTGMQVTEVDVSVDDLAVPDT